MKNVLSLLAFLSERSLRVVLIPHYRPDADALGSALALSMYLRKKGHETQVISPSEYPLFLAWMEDAEDVLRYEASCLRCKKKIKEADLLFFVDFSASNRMGEAMQAAIAESSARRALIDHHPGIEKNMAEFSFWSPQAAAAAQLVFDFICLDGGESLISKEIATCLYAGIVTDTGSFRFASSTSRVHYSAARLIELGGIDVRKVSDLLYGNYSLRRVRFLGFALSHCLVVYPKLYTAFFVLKAKDMQRFHPENGDTEGLVNYALSIEDIHLGALIKEVGGEVRLSLRSKGSFAVNELAKQYFNGGGHRNAAGGICQEKLQSVVDRFKAILPQYKRALSEENISEHHPYVQSGTRSFLYFATQNKHKLKEAQQILGDNHLIKGLDELHDAPLREPYLSLRENAATKATYIGERYAVDCFAEDTGLFVDALKEMPGVHTSRYAGPEASDEENCRKLLAELREKQDRRAYFCSVVALLKNKQLHFFEACCYGHISPHMKGSAGFGYDAVFVPKGSSQTFAQMLQIEKNHYSHRRKVLEALKVHLEQKKVDKENVLKSHPTKHSSGRRSALDLKALFLTQENTG